MRSSTSLHPTQCKGAREAPAWRRSVWAREDPDDQERPILFEELALKVLDVVEGVTALAFEGIDVSGAGAAWRCRRNVVLVGCLDVVVPLAVGDAISPTCGALLGIVK